MVLKISSPERAPLDADLAEASAEPIGLMFSFDAASAILIFLVSSTTSVSASAFAAGLVSTEATLVATSAVSAATTAPVEEFL